MTFMVKSKHEPLEACSINEADSERQMWEHKLNPAEDN